MYFCLIQITLTNNSNSMFKLKSLCVLTLSMSFSVLSAQNLYNQSLRNWDEGPVTWSDFQERHIPDDSKYVSNLSCSIEKDVKKEKVGNFKFPVLKTTTKMSKLASWYDPDKCNDWTLRYEQTRFDMLEVLRRRMQNSFNRNFMEENLEAYYQQVINNTMSAIDMESNYGTDTAVVLRYEQQYRNELDTMTMVPVQVPVFETGNWGLSFNVGVEFENFGSPMSKGVSSVTGLKWGFGTLYKKWSFDFNGLLGWSGDLKCDNFYYDSKYDYTWSKGKKVTGGNITLGAGYKVLDNSNISLTPFAGIGVTFVDQNSDTPRYNNNNVFENSEISGFRTQAGLAFDWKFRRNLNIYGYGGDYTESKVRFAITGARTNFKTIGPTYSLNLSILFQAESWFLK